MKLDRRQLRKIILFEANKLTLNEQTASIDAFKEQSGKTYDRIVQGYEASDTALGKLTGLLSAMLDINIINMTDFLSHVNNPQPLIAKFEAEGLDAALAELIASPEL